jgi:error-prone DNA polymerase
MVICDRPVVEVCPVEWARVSGRTVLQWDKESCAEAGLVKFDLLGLGMLSALHEMVDLVERHYGIKIDLARLEQDDEVYDMLCRADTVGVFQVESRAQMATLPRLQPRRFYDLVVEVALIRPGPIQGDSVHPYIRRRNGLEPVTYLHPLLERSLAKTLGVPLFQEQLMQMAMDVANFSAADADRLRQAMGSKRSAERMEELRERFYAGMAANQITGEVADQIFAKMAAFANFGFPESHSASFAYLVYASAWFKLHYPAAFYAALLNCQPMGFWSPATLVADARRHQVKVRRADVNHSRAKCHLEPNPDTPSELGLRLSLNSVRSVSTSTAEQIALGQPYVDLEDLARRAALTKEQLSALAEAGALGSLSHPQESAATGRRRDMWRAGAVGLYRDHSAPRLASAVRPDPLPGLGSDLSPPDLAPMTLAEEVAADMSTTGVPLAANPIELARAFLDGLGATTAGQLANLSTGQKVVIGGLVTHRQRPATAKGTVFVNLEDETGLVNVICPAGIWKRFAHVARSAAALVVTGRLESNQGAVAVVAHKIVRLDLNLATTAWRSRDFQ